MRRGSIFVILFIVIAVGVILVSQFLRSQPAYTITVAVTPLAETWARASAAAFNATQTLTASGRRMTVQIETADDLDVWEADGSVNWTAASHPDAWIAANGLSVEYATQLLPLTLVNSESARTVLLWGGFSDSVNVLTSDGARTLDWEDVARAAQTDSWADIPGGNASWGFFKTAIQRPNSSIAAMAVVLSAAAAYDDAPLSDTLRSSAFREWFAPFITSVPNFNTLGSSPASALATRGASVADIALLAESEWLTNLKSALVNETNPIRFSYPAAQFVFTFPLAAWNDPVNDETTAVVNAFAAYLLSDAGQAAAQAAGLRPLVETDAAPLFANAVELGVRVPLPTAQTVELPQPGALRDVISWLNSLVR